LRAASVVAVPNSGKFEVSVRDTNPLKLYEALAAEAPVLASDLPSIREAAAGSKAVRYALADDASAWGRALATLLNDPAALDTMRQTAHATPFLVPKVRAAELVRFFNTLRPRRTPSL
jgi:glycosyltransferase involved in cell wall biosynthesis